MHESEGFDHGIDQPCSSSVQSCSLHPETGAALHVKRVIATADLMCILSSAGDVLNVITCDASCCMLVLQSFQEVFNVVWKLDCIEFPLICHGGRRSRGVLVVVCNQGVYWIHRVASKIVFQPLVPDTGALLHEQFVCAVRQEFNVHYEFYLRNVTGGMRTPWKLFYVGVTECTRRRQVA